MLADGIKQVGHQLVVDVRPEIALGNTTVHEVVERGSRQFLRILHVFRQPRIFHQVQVKSGIHGTHFFYLHTISLQHDVDDVVSLVSIAVQILALAVVVDLDTLDEQRLLVVKDFIQRAFRDAELVGQVVHLDRTDAVEREVLHGTLNDGLTK